AKMDDDEKNFYLVVEADSGKHTLQRAVAFRSEAECAQAKAQLQRTLFRDYKAEVYCSTSLEHRKRTLPSLEHLIRQFVAISERGPSRLRPSLLQAKSNLSVEFANTMQYGVCSYKYKGVDAFKCPMDLALYMDVFYELKPGTVLEFGSWAGGSALW